VKMWIGLFFTLVVLSVIWVALGKYRTAKPYLHLPKVEGYPWGVYWETIRGNFHVILKKAQSTAPVCRLSMFFFERPIVVISDVKAIKEILSETGDRYTKTFTDPTDEREITARGLARVHGPTWDRQRKLIAPFFSTKSVFEMSPRMQEALDFLILKWKTEVAQTNDYTIDIKEEYSLFTMEGVARALFGVDFDVQESTKQKWWVSSPSFLTILLLEAGNLTG